MVGFGLGGGGLVLARAWRRACSARCFRFFCDDRKLAKNQMIAIQISPPKSSTTYVSLLLEPVTPLSPAIDRRILVSALILR